jgi:hypothetical protein
MNADERIADLLLRSLDLGPVVYEPDGNTPPDFVVGGRIAVEVRRLNQHYESDGERRALEEDTIPLRQRFDNLLASFPTGTGATWFVLFSFRRPLTEWKKLRPQIVSALRAFLLDPVDDAWRIRIESEFAITTLRASTPHSRCFLLGGYTDMDAGGWVVSEIIQNVTACMIEKSQKVAPHVHKYSVWWLLLVDYIGTSCEAAEVRQHISRLSPWNRVLILNPVELIAYDL